MGPESFNLVTVTGPTASGKTAFAAHLAAHLDGEIISADSRQVYRNMDLGTGKDYTDYQVQNRRIPYHLIDIVEPGYKYNVFEYQQDFRKCWKDILLRKRIPILCGGSGLYIDAVTSQYKLISVPENQDLRRELETKSLDELAAMLRSMKIPHNKTDVDTREHALRALEIEQYYSENKDIDQDILSLNTLFLGIRFDRHEERRRITKRLKERLKQGLVDEVIRLLDKGLTPEDLIYYGLEYKYITLYITRKLTYEDMVTKLNTAIHQYAKRQMTWFRKMERQGTIIHWIDGGLSMEKKIHTAMRLIKRNY